MIPPVLGIQGLRIRGEGLGYGVRGERCGAQGVGGVGFRVQVLVARIQGREFRVWSSAFSVLGLVERSGFWGLG